LGIPTFEDKVLQRAVVMVLEAVYEQDFRDCSYGYRPGRSAHQALDALRQQLMGMGGGWVVEVDIRKFFDTLDHAHLRELLRRRIRDGVLIRLIGKWLNAGVLEDGSLTFPDAGSPQGGVVSPLLANVYLHYVLDVWFEEEVKPRLKGRAFLIRYADDFVIGFAREEDARPQRSGKDRGSRPGTFDLLGFTHYWARSRKGNWVVKRKTAADRLRRAVRMLAHWCQRHCHESIAEQHQALWHKLRGHYAYFGITGNSEALRRFRDAVTRTWRFWLARRSWQAARTWASFSALLQRYPLPPALAVHSAYRR
jgi:hypothetical protein